MPEKPQELPGAEQGSPPPGAEQGTAEQGSPPPGAEQGAAEQGSPPPGAEQGTAEQGSPPPGAEQGAAEQGSPPPGAEQGAAEQGSPPPGAEQGTAEQGSPPPDTPGPSQGKKIVPGILYLGHIPPRFRPRHVRNLLSVHGEVGRIFLQPEERFVRQRKKKAGAKAKNYTEGWVEFRDKRVAKLVAASLHNTPMGTRRRSRFHYDLWNIKYLHRFKWPHLSERLAYERQVRHQRLRAEISQAKRETNFYLRSVETSQRFARRAAAAPAGGEEKSWGFVQRPTEEEIQRRKAGGGRRRLRGQLARAQEIQLKSQTSRSLLAKIFNAADAASDRAPGGPDLQ